MFDGCHSSIEVTLAPVASRRDGWHPESQLGREDALLRHLDPEELSPDEALSALVAIQEHRARWDALETSLLVRAAGATGVVRDVLMQDDADRGERKVSLVDEVVDEIACALHRSYGVVIRQVHHARVLYGPLARTHAELAAGRITLQHASAIAEQADRLVDATAYERLQDRVLPYAVAETPAQTRSRARRAVVAIDPSGERTRRQRARRGCDVSAYAIDDGMAIVEARLPLGAAAWVIATVDASTRCSVRDGRASDPEWLSRHGLEPEATIGQLRAAAFVDLIRAGLSDTDETAGVGATRLNVEVQVMVDAATLAGLDADGVAWTQVGSGAPEAFGREDLVRLLADPTTHASFRRMITDPATGALVDRGARTYAPSPSLTAWLAARDGTCRFPGCVRRAARCEVDHAVDFADGGTTTIGNTGMLCRRHHNRKTHAGWEISDSQPDGSCILTSPAGRRYRHAPVELIPPTIQRTAPPPAPPPPGGTDARRQPEGPFPF